MLYSDHVITSATGVHCQSLNIRSFSASQEISKHAFASTPFLARRYVVSRRPTLKKRRLVTVIPCHYPYVPYSKNFGERYLNRQSFFRQFFQQGFRHTFYRQSFLLYGNCKKCCLGHCKCHKANIKCTQLCYYCTVVDSALSNKCNKSVAIIMY